MLSRNQLELAFRGYNIHLSLAKKGQIANDIVEFVRPTIMKQELERDKDYYRIVIENMEDVLDILEKYIEKGDEGSEKLTKALQEANELQERIEGLRKEMKDRWRASIE